MRNDPYDERTAEYDTFTQSWYIGVSVGALMKTAVGASFAKFLRGTKSFRAIEDKFDTTRIGKVYGGVSTRLELVQAKAASAALSKADPALTPLVKKADTAAAIVRSSRLARGLDTSRLTRSETGRLGRVVQWADERTARAIRRADSDEQRDIADIAGCDPDDFTGVPGGFSRAGPTVVADGGVAVQRGAFPAVDGPALVTAGACEGEIPAELRGRVANELIGFEVDGELSSAEFGRLVQQFDEASLVGDTRPLYEAIDSGSPATARVIATADADALGRLDDSVPLAKLATRPGTFQRLSIENRVARYELEARTGGGTVDTDILYAEDSADVFEQAAQRADYGSASAGEYVDPDNPRATWRTLDDSGARARFVEEKLTPYVLEEQYGLDILCVDVGCGDGANGIDALAWDPDRDKLVVIESKWTTSPRGASAAKLGDARDGTPENAIQMTNEWIDDAWQTGREQDDIDLRDSVESRDDILERTGEESLEDAVDTIVDARAYDRAYFYVSDSRNGKTVSGLDSRNRYVSDVFDSVYHFKAGDLTDD